MAVVDQTVDPEILTELNEKELRQISIALLSEMNSSPQIKQALQARAKKAIGEIQKQRGTVKSKKG